MNFITGKKRNKSGDNVSLMVKEIRSKLGLPVLTLRQAGFNLIGFNPFSQHHLMTLPTWPNQFLKPFDLHTKATGTFGVGMRYTGCLTDSKTVKNKVYQGI